MYVVAINRGGTAEPDAIYLVGTDPQDSATYGKIFNRVDAPNVGDELHHFGLTHDRKRLVAPGLFSGRINVFDVSADPRHPTVKATADATVTGYIVPHSVVPIKNGEILITMVGAATATTGPGGVVRIDDWTGRVIENFGPGPTDANRPGPEYMYDIDPRPAINRAISTTFGWPANVGGGINPAGLGNTVNVWDYKREKVIQTVDLGANSGSLEIRFLHPRFSRYAYVNSPGTGVVWLAEDEDCDGRFTFHQVINTGLAIPVDMILSNDDKYLYLTNWFGDNVQQYDISDRYHPVLKGQATVPHANMVRLSSDGERLYVTNELLSTWDDDPNFGPARNTNYGLWAFNVDTHNGGLTSFTADGSAWVSFDAVQKQSTVGPAGPHMMLFDPDASAVDQH